MFTLQGALVRRFCILGTVTCVYIEPLSVKIFYLLYWKGLHFENWKNKSYFINDLLFWKLKKWKNGKMYLIFLILILLRHDHKVFASCNTLKNWRIWFNFFFILILKSHGHKRFCFLQYIDFWLAQIFTHHLPFWACLVSNLYIAHLKIMKEWTNKQTNKGFRINWNPNHIK